MINIPENCRIRATYCQQLSPALSVLSQQLEESSTGGIRFYGYMDRYLMAKVEGEKYPLNLGHRPIMPRYNEKGCNAIDITAVIDDGSIPKLKEIRENATKSTFFAVCFGKYDLWQGEIELLMYNMEMLEVVSIDFSTNGTVPIWLGDVTPEPESGKMQYVSFSDFNDIIGPFAPQRLRGLWYTYFKRGKETLFVFADTTGKETVLKGPGTYEDLEPLMKEMEDRRVI